MFGMAFSLESILLVLFGVAGVDQRWCIIVKASVQREVEERIGFCDGVAMDSLRRKESQDIIEDLRKWIK